MSTKIKKGGEFKMVKIVAVLITLLMFVGVASAIEFTQSGAMIEYSYTEPTTNADGSILDDLAFCSIYYDMGNGVVKAEDVPTTSMNGGGNVRGSFVVPIAEGQDVSVMFWATCTDDNKNESAKSNVITLRIDRLAPAPPR